MEKIQPSGSTVQVIEDLSAVTANGNGAVDLNIKANDSAGTEEGPGHVSRGSFALWQKQNSVFPLQTDAAALEYLSGFDYDVEKAWFHLCCMLSCGKG